MPIRRSDAYEGDGGAYTRRYHDQEHINKPATPGFRPVLVPPRCAA
jgi:hypothetical protein